MTKHNGKARKAGTRVGAALTNRSKQGGPTNPSAMFRHTTDITNGQSVLERGDLEELMAMADLADRDFTAERGQAVVIVSGAVDPLAEERNELERREAEVRNKHRLKLPRRPNWTPDMTAEELDLQERSSFLTWRRNLATLEEEEGLVLTPFEKNLEVWRQLWRVLERSDIVVQVVDARDPLLYRSTDLEAYAREINSTKSSFILMNKSDLLPDHVRTLWADYFDELGLDYAFWSAFKATEDLQHLKAQAQELGLDVYDLKERLRMQAGEERDEEEDVRIKILDGEDLLELMEDRARMAVQAGGQEDPRLQDTERRLTVGLVGYPNVGKSSTINALFGSKKTAVAPTPGKTKHFQTLNVSSTLCLCDCPGLVLPVFAKSKAAMVVAGVIPIDRLTDIRAPVEVVAQRLGRWQIENYYGFRLPPPQPHELSSTPPTALQLLRTLAVMRGWTAGSGLPDESRAGRVILRDYTNGKLVHCALPPGSASTYWVPGEEFAGKQEASRDLAIESEGIIAASERVQVMGMDEDQLETSVSGGTAENVRAHTLYSTPKYGALVSDRPVPSTQLPFTPADPASSSKVRRDGKITGAGAIGSIPLDEADLDMLHSMDSGQNSARRPEYKFHKKAARSKGDRGQLKGEGGFDGGAMLTGKKGGLVRVTGY